MNTKNDRGMKRGRYRGGYQEYYPRGGQNRPRGSYNSYRGYMPQGRMKLPNQGYQSYMQGAGGTPMMPGGPGMVIPPEMFAELQKKLKEKFPDANIPLTQEGLLSNVPIQLPMSNMRFKPPMHLVPDSSGYYGDNNNQNKKKVNKEKRKEKEVKEPEPVVQESEELFKNYNEEEKQISNEEETHMQELDSFDKLTTEDK